MQRESTSSSKANTCYFMSRNKIPTLLITDFVDSQSNPNYLIVENGDGLRTFRSDLPFRKDYYALGVCFRGEATLGVNLRTYHVRPGAIVVGTPEVITQWHYISLDHLSIGLLFKKDYLLANCADPNLLDSFPFFHFGSPPVSFLTPQKAELLGNCLKNIKKASQLDHAHRDEVVRSLILAFLYNATGVYEENSTLSVHPNTRQEIIFSQFQHLVSRHIKTERALPFYAAELHVTAKHLSETIKKVSGKTARQWINEAVTLEAKVLLQDKLLTIGQVAELLSFPDQSSFGKFFKGQTGHSPSAFQQAL